MMKLILRSPFHFVLSNSVLLLTFAGRKTGRLFTTPLRYVKDGATIRCFTSEQTKWWRNLRGGAPARLHIRGKTMSYQGHVLDISVEEKAYLLQQYLAQFPQDAPYHEVTLDKGKKPKDSDIALASESAVVVEFRET